MRVRRDGVVRVYPLVRTLFTSILCRVESKLTRSDGGWSTDRVGVSRTGHLRVLRDTDVPTERKGSRKGGKVLTPGRGFEVDLKIVT